MHVGANAVLETSLFTFFYATPMKEGLGEMPCHKHFDGLQIPEHVGLCLTYYSSVWNYSLCYHGLLHVNTSRVSIQREVIPVHTTKDCVEGLYVEPEHIAIQSVIEFRVQSLSFGAKVWHAIEFWPHTHQCHPLLTAVLRASISWNF